ncbi:hypothetical protein HN51_030407 [Arachis hypogaea]|uniref:NAC transcription factor 25 n=1 Tax=Arachis hypogaea TaxID=3818 RepID=UPI000DEC944D|nr:NAC transcription factor 25 [Arachis hypogaea]QHO14883.1 NAC transcription factor [Arachis hypogaea]
MDSCQPQLPPGFRFHPTDEELIVHYLKRKASSAPLPVAIIADVDLYKFDPWELPSKATFGEQEWYFFSPRDRKYPNGARPNRAATSGYWKATGTDKPIIASDGQHRLGVKKALVFYGGKPPKGVKTNWIMHEYRLTTTHNNNSISSKSFPSLPSNLPSSNQKKNSLRLDDWVLCRIYEKSNRGNFARTALMEHHDHDDDDDNKDQLSAETTSMIENMSTMSQNSKPTQHYGPLLVQNDDNFFDGILAADHQNHQHHNLPMKRALVNMNNSQFWNETNKRFHCDLNNNTNTVANIANNDEDNTSFVSLLSHNQIPHPTNNASLLGPTVADGVFRQHFQLQTINWNL